MKKSLPDWLAWISAQHPSNIALGLDRVREVLGRMELSSVAPAKAGGRPCVVTVGGTNGKGSTCAMLERILLEAGYRVGTYTSPHILRYNERVRLQGEDVDDATLVRSFERVEAARGSTPLTYFEFGTLAALAVFTEAQVEAMVLEVGLGGRLDAVNLVDADCSIVASVDIDHVDWLGGDRESIGFEKAGIFRPGRPAIFGDTNPPRRLVEQAAAIGADLQVLGRDFRVESHPGQWDFVGRRGAKHALPIPALRGRWQLKNAASAIAALDELAARLPVSIGEVRRGLALVRLAGRLQSLPGRPTIVLDVAHNPHAARALADALGEMAFAENTLAVFAMLADKDIAGVVDAVKARIDRWYVSAAQAERAAPAARVAEILAQHDPGKPLRSFATVDAALAAARGDAGPNDRIVVFGSFTTVAEALRSAR
ncbi:MAG TPA: bifunctional tetrahydrofolate synthase/dihydrofolate synthase [Usitatibacter sp.]|nr:bifunctional tetrahydrofolate synthase/dihydrofolate synthase [Usitatibacter sp.]